MGKCLDYWERRSVNLKKTGLAFPASRGLSRRGKNERKERSLRERPLLPRRERPLLAGKDWLAGISLNAFKMHVVQLCCSLGLLVSLFQIFVANEISPSNLKKENPPGVDIPSGSAAMNKIIYKIQVQMMTKPLTIRFDLAYKSCAVLLSCMASLRRGKRNNLLVISLTVIMNFTCFFWALM